MHLKGGLSYHGGRRGRRKGWGCRLHSGICGTMKGGIVIALAFQKIVVKVTGMVGVKRWAAVSPSYVGCDVLLVCSGGNGARKPQETKTKIKKQKQNPQKTPKNQPQTNKKKGEKKRKKVSSVTRA